MIWKIEEVWGDLRGQSVSPVHRRCPAGDHIELYAQIDNQYREGLLGIATRRPSVPHEFDAVDLQVRERTDGRWAVSMSLRDPSLRKIFVRMCDEISRDAAEDVVSRDAGHFLVSSLLRWHRLLALGANGVLGEGAQAGLFGEMLLLRASMARYGVIQAVEGWNGPEGAPQDFDLPLGLIEVKTLRVGAQELSISSVDQLDVDGAALFIATLRLGIPVRASDGCTLLELVSQLRVLAAREPAAATMLERKLVEAGYEDHEAYGVKARVVKSEQWYEVKEAFPRLRRREISSGIAGAVYTIRLAALEEYKYSSELSCQ